MSEPTYRYREAGMPNAAETQILADLRSITASLATLGERIAVLETLLRDQARDHQDHEDRIRALERSTESYAGADEFAELRREADTHVTRADLRDQQADRSRKAWLMWGVVATIIVPAWTLILNLVFNGKA